VFKGLDGADEIAARDTGVAFLNVLLRGCNLVRIYICNDGLIDGDLRSSRELSARAATIAVTSANGLSIWSSSRAASPTAAIADPATRSAAY
jgi:hypothetical protein